MKTLIAPPFGLAMLAALTVLAGCCSSSLGGGGSKPSTTYVVLPNGQTVQGQTVQGQPSAVPKSN